jgi:hypothetical protein
MAVFKATLSGLGALIALAVVGFLVWQWNTGLNNAENPALTDAINKQLYQQYFPQQVEALSDALAAGNFGDAISMARDSALTLHSVRTLSPLLRLAPTQTVIVKVDYSMDLGGDSGKRQTRYMQFEHQPTSNRWRYQYDVHALSFWLNAL